MSHQNLIDLLPLYAAGSLENDQRLQIERHLAGCPACRAELALWKAVGAEISAADQSLRLPPVQTILHGVDLQRPAAESRPGPISRALQLLRAQIPLVQRDLWLASAAVFAIGFCSAALVGRPGVFQAVAPLVAAASVAVIYGPESDPALELALSTPTSPRQVLLARLTLVFSYDLALALAASVGFLAIVPLHLLGSLITGWLGPMAFLSALALVLSNLIGARNAITLALLVWSADWAAFGALQGYFPQLVFPFLQTLASAYTAFFASPVWLFSTAGLLTALTFWLVGRLQPFRPDLG